MKDVGKGARIRRERKARQEAKTTSPPGLSPVGAEMLQARMERGAALLAQVSPAEIPDALGARRQRVLELCERFDALDVLAGLARSAVALRPEHYVESEMPISQSDVELCAGILLSRSTRGTSAEHAVLDGNLFEPLREVLGEMLGLLAYRGFARAAERDDLPAAEAQTMARAGAHHLWTRGSGYHWQERVTVGEIFDAQAVRDDLRSLLGFDGHEAMALCEASHAALEDHLNSRLEEGREAVDVLLAGGGHPMEQWARQAASGFDRGPRHFAVMAMAMLWGMRQLGDLMTVSTDELVERSGIDRPTVEAYLKVFCIGFGQEQSEPLAAMEMLRERPLIVAGEDRHFPVMPGADVWALRPAFERALIGAGGATKQRYLDARADWLERQVAHLLGATLKPDAVHESLRYRIREADGSHVDGEIDVLVELGDTLLVVEAKSATLPVSGRRGGESLIQHLKKNLARAAVQGERARQAVLDPASAEFLDDRGQPVSLLAASVREVHPIVVTLDDLSVVTPVIWQLVGTRVMPEGVTVPWAVNRHDLQTICELVDLPAQLVHFLRRRARLNQLGGRVASDELDWFSLYLHNSLYFEEDQDDELVSYASMTDRFDAYFLARQRGDPSVPRPAQQLGSQTRKVLEFLDTHRPPGAMAAACSLLDIATASREEMLDELTDLRRLAGRRGRVQRSMRLVTHPYTLMLCTLAVPESGRGSLSDELARYADERLAEQEAQRVLALGVSAGNSLPLEALLVLEPPVWQLPEAADVA